MSWQRTVKRGLALIKKRKLDAELDADIRAHLELAEDDALSRGLSEEEAKQEARRKFGTVARVKEEQRERRTFAGIETFLRDFRYGLSSLRRTPGFASIVIAVLAVGIGGTVAMFSIVDAVLVKPLPFPQPDRIVGLWEAPRPGVTNATTPLQFLTWKRLDSDFEAMSAEQGISAALNSGNTPIHLEGKLVTSEYFKVFGVNASRGRTFTPTDEAEHAPLIVLSHAAWRTYFGSDSGILERPVLLDGQSCRVVGILRPSAFDRDNTHFWKLLAFTPDQLSSTIHWLALYGRLKPEVTLQRARERMRAVYAALRSNKLMDEYPEGSLEIESLSTLLIGRNLERSVTIAFGAVLLVLFIACANVANLLFSRAVTRQTELAIRSALGAGRTRLATQLLTECLAICALGGAAGIGLALLLIRIAKPVLADALPFTADVTLNAHTLLFVMLVVLGVALLIGILPALQGSLGELAESLKKSTRSSSEGNVGIRRLIVIIEVALSLVLLCGALLLTRSLRNLRNVATGIRIDQVVTAALDLPVTRYSTPQRASVFYRELSEKIRNEPGIASIGISTFLPLNWISNGEGIFVPGAQKPVMVRFKRVDPGYFRTLDIPILSGRSFTEQDREGAPTVVIVNQSLMARLAEVGLTDAIGKSISVTSGDYSGQKPLTLSASIVGMIRNERTTSPGRPEPPVVYVPLAQAPHPGIKLLVRSGLNTGNVATALRRSVKQLDPNLPLTEIATMRQVQEATLTSVSRPAALISAFAFVAIFLAVIGLYGVISYSVTQRRKELGIRLALGARSGHLLSHVIGRAMVLAGTGILVGLAGVYVTTRVLRSLLFEVSPLDPLALVLGCAAMMLLCLVAAYLPARRAASLDPTMTLRDV